ncbi:MAG: enoyl-CoA hydratase-related protein [Longimicrobiales bacterium]|nr:enoyl-CoA hydratase-related protein [Longimicrobiales bacterium]
MSPADTLDDFDPGTDHLRVREEDGVAVLTLHRPEARNALSPEMLEGLARALERAERSTTVRSVVVTGAGGAFCAGGDVKAMARSGDPLGGTELTVDERIHRQRLMQRNTAGRIHLMPKPVIAMLPGPAAGAGLSLALAADLRTMSEAAFVTTAFARVGFSGDFGGTFFLSQLVGSGKAKELYFLSERIGAEECERLGIANFVFGPDELEERTLDLARRLARGPSVAYRYMKENFLRAATGGDLVECLDLEATHHIHTGLTEDHEEAAAAFVEKREPEFRGR